ncbi:MAG: Xylulose kinase [Acidimicrobiales bacterium]|nr:MAG: xylulose kinase [Actinomycetota bacterium]MBV6507699.1 Xylulose kinase [Acidimicrobiales bacterium]RIK07625.1 MAG: xylulose kinase [Acidobacteriota bacterium]
MTKVTVGIDIGSTSVKAVAADDDGNVVRRTRIPHELRSPQPDQLEHDAATAWRHDVVRAFEEISSGLDVAAVNVAAMVPSLCAVDDDGIPVTPGLLYGDARGRGTPGLNPAESGEFLKMLEWTAEQAPDAAGYWPAQAVANHALAGEGVIDFVTAMSCTPVFTFEGWDADVAAGAGASVEQLPKLVMGAKPAGTVDGATLAPGTIDAFGEQQVAGAENDGDVLVIFGATLVIWAVVPEWQEAPGLWTVPHTAPGKCLIGGASNAGGLFLNWATGFMASPSGQLHPDHVPVWLPYVRGERTPLHDPAVRSSIHDMDLTTGAKNLERAAYEAAGFVIRHHLDIAGLTARRIVASGGGVRVPEWLQAVADATETPVDAVAVPEGGALGAAWLARSVIGLEDEGVTGLRWARTGERYEPREAWTGPARQRYARFRQETARLVAEA